MSDSLICWSQGQTDRAILIVHGVGEYGARYERFAKQLTSKGIDVYSYDQVGHGNRDQLKGHIDSWSDYRVELAQRYQEVLNKGYKKVGVWGHSMGSLVTLEWLQQTDTIPPFVILSGTLVEAKAEKWRIMAAKLLSKLAPRFRLPLGLDLDGISSIESEVQLYREDPLVNDKVSAAWGAEVLRVIPEVRAHIQSVRSPLLVAHGKDDPINDVAGSRWLADTLNGVELLVYEGVRHEVHHDKTAEDFAQKMADFAGRH